MSSARTLSPVLPPALEPAGPASPVAPYRRGRGKVLRRQRSRLLALLLRFAGPLAILALAAAGAVWVANAPAFALARVEVAGTSRVAPDWVRGELAPLVGSNLPRLPLWQVEARLVAHPWAASVAIQKHLPDGIEVRIVERRPAAVVTRDGIAWWVESGGRLIDRLSPAEAAPGLPRLIEAGAGARGDLTTSPAVPTALATLADLAAVAPAWAKDLTEVRLLSRDELELSTTALEFPLRLRAGRVKAKVKALQRLLPEIRARYSRLDAVDLRFSRRIVLSPTSKRDLAALETAAAAAAVAEEAPAPEEPFVEGDPGDLVRPVARGA